MSKLIKLTNPEEVPELIKEAICYYRGCYPQYSDAEIARRVNKNLDCISIDEKLVLEILELEPDRLFKHKFGGAESVKLGILLGELKFSTLHSRVKFLTDIMIMGKEGYEEQKATNRGDIVTLTAKNLNASLEAHKQLGMILEKVDSLTEREEEVFLEVDVYPQFLPTNNTASNDEDDVLD